MSKCQSCLVACVDWWYLLAMPPRILDPFLDWYHENLGVHFPDGLIEQNEWYPINPNNPGAIEDSHETLLFGNQPALDAPATVGTGIMAPFAAVANKQEYSMLGFWGHGINSYAVYYVRFDSWRRVYLRLPFGGVYMDQNNGAQLVRYLEQYQVLQEYCSKHAEMIQLINSMGGGTCEINWRNSSKAPYKTENIDLTQSSLLDEIIKSSKALSRAIFDQKITPPN